MYRYIRRGTSGAANKPVATTVPTYIYNNILLYYIYDGDTPATVVPDANVTFMYIGVVCLQ